MHFRKNLKCKKKIIPIKIFCLVPSECKNGKHASKFTRVCRYVDMGKLHTFLKIIFGSFGEYESPTLPFFFSKQTYKNMRRSLLHFLFSSFCREERTLRSINEYVFLSTQLKKLLIFMENCASEDKYRCGTQRRHKSFIKRKADASILFSLPFLAFTL